MFWGRSDIQAPRAVEWSRLDSTAGLAHFCASCQGLLLSQWVTSPISRPTSFSNWPRHIIAINPSRHNQSINRPTDQPASQPTNQQTDRPTHQPTNEPTNQRPTNQPTNDRTNQPTQPNPTQPNPTQPNPTQPNPTQPNPTQPNPNQPTRPTRPTEQARTQIHQIHQIHQPLVVFPRGTQWQLRKICQDLEACWTEFHLAVQAVQEASKTMQGIKEGVGCGVWAWGVEWMGRWVNGRCVRVWLVVRGLAGRPSKGRVDGAWG